ncbi:hypothetical protein EON63_02990 [archaeon]|nr:MAG: hypothetical protein EON63_02990 [archaeon]
MEDIWMHIHIFTHKVHYTYTCTYTFTHAHTTYNEFSYPHPYLYNSGSYYVSTHPSSFFSYAIMVGTFTRSNDRCVLFNTDFTRRNAAGIVEKYEVDSKEEYLSLLKEVFGLPVHSLRALKVPGKDWDFSEGVV